MQRMALSKLEFQRITLFCGETKVALKYQLVVTTVQAKIIVVRTRVKVADEEKQAYRG